MKAIRAPLLAVLAAFLGLFLVAQLAVALWSQPLPEFSVNPPSLLINWTQSQGDRNYGNLSYFGNITIELNNSYYNVTLKLSNNTETWHKLIRSNSFRQLSVIASNETMIVTGLNLTNSTGLNILNITFYVDAKSQESGRYTGALMVYNASNFTNANVTVNITVDIPLVLSEAALSSNIFYGNLSSNGLVEYYFFNASRNMTGLKIELNLSNSNDMDVFLYDSNAALLAYGTNSTGNTETLAYSFLGESGYNRYYEIRAYGTNVSTGTNFTAALKFIALNSTARFLDFGVLNATGQQNYSVAASYTLQNVQNATQNVTEAVEIYRYQRYLNALNYNYTNNFTVIVPANSTKIYALLEWPNASAIFDLNVYKPGGALAVAGRRKMQLVNATALNFGRSFAIAEYTLDSNNNVWTIGVNGSAAAVFNLTIRTYVSPAAWFNSSFGNYAGAYLFNATNDSTRLQTVQLNMTVPYWAMDGQYNGSVSYANALGTGASIAIPFGVNVTSAVLMVNNTLKETTLSIYDNSDIGRTRMFALLINNSGSFDLNISSITNSSVMNHTVSPSYYIMFNHSILTNVPARGSALFFVNLNISQNTTQNASGIYSGWVSLNSANGHPYDSYRIVLNLNLSRLLDVNIVNITSNTSSYFITSYNASNENVTVNYATVKYMNGTTISGLTTYNFTLQLQAPPAAGGATTALSNFTATDDYGSGRYVINATVPGTLPGGNYSLALRANSSDNALSGTGTWGYSNWLVINKTGMHIAAVSTTTIAITAGVTPAQFTAKVRNFGSLSTTTANVTFVQCTGMTPKADVATAYAGACDATASGASFILSMSGYNVSDTGCQLRWNITGNTESTCTAMVMGTAADWYNNITSISVTVTNTTSSSSSSSSGGSSVGGSTGNPLSLAVGIDKTLYDNGDTIRMSFEVKSGSSWINQSTVYYNLTDAVGSRLVTNANCATNSTGRCDSYYTLQKNAAAGNYTLSATAAKSGYDAATRSLSFGVQSKLVPVIKYENKIYVLQGSSNATEVKVNNTGSVALTVRLRIDGIQASWWGGAATSVTLSPNVSASFFPNFTVPADAVIGDYPGTFTVYNVADNAVIDSKSFTLSVTPTQETKVSIVANVTAYSRALENISSRYNATEKITGATANMTAARTKILLAAEKMNLVNDAVARQDYATASRLLIGVAQSLGEADALLAPIEAQAKAAESWNASLLIVGAVAAVAVGAFFVYIMLPPPGYHPQKGYTPQKQQPTEKNLMEKIKEALRNLFRRRREGGKNYSYDFMGGWKPK